MPDTLKPMHRMHSAAEPPLPVPASTPALAQTLLAWYHTVKRDLPWRQTHDPYAIWVSEVMLQQTQVKTVIPYYLRFLERFPALNDLAAAELEEIFSYWRGLGYYARARHLWEGAHFVVNELNAVIPRTYEGLRRIPGIGEYTAGAVASIAFGERVPAIDGNVRRILSRILAWPHPIESALSRREFQKRSLEWMPASPTEDCGQTPGDFSNAPGDFNQALMELGATVCLSKNPRCPACPLSHWCQAQTPEVYPVKRPPKNPAEVIRLTFILIHQGKFYLKKRPSEGLLAGLLEFPGCELPLPEPCANPDDYFALFQKAVSDRSFDRHAQRFFRTSPVPRGPARHTFSHRRWNLYWFIIPVESLPFPDIVKETVKETLSPSETARWLSIEELGTAPIPTAFRIIIDDVRNRLG